MIYFDQRNENTFFLSVIDQFIHSFSSFLSINIILCTSNLFSSNHDAEEYPEMEDDHLDVEDDLKNLVEDQVKFCSVSGLKYFCITH